MPELNLSERVIDVLKRVADGKCYNCTLLRVLDFHESNKLRTLEEEINRNPDYLREFIYIRNDELCVKFIEPIGRWKLEPKNTIDIENIINQAVDCLINAAYIDEMDGDIYFAFGASDADKQAIKKHVNRVLVEYYCKCQHLI